MCAYEAHFAIVWPDHTQLSGTIPSSLGNLTALTNFDVRNTNVTADDVFLEGTTMRGSYGGAKSWSDWRGGGPCYVGNPHANNWHIWSGVTCHDGRVTR
eukprot:SAG31_NODE_8484_length_1442_cov_12.180938_2_plen_98_part_01